VFNFSVAPFFKSILASEVIPQRGHISILN
jgi:hypothetical protein